MPITCTKRDDSPLCRGHDWEVLDEGKLVKLLSRLVTGYHLHVANILKDPKSPMPKGPALSLDHLIERLGPPKSDALRYHRDGWIFQLISWIAAHLTTSAKVLIAPPQGRTADKGFDGLMVELHMNGKDIEGIVVCEDKATEEGRETIRDKVWPELVNFELGARDAELQNEVTVLLTGLKGDIPKMIEKIHWQEKRRYRVSVTVSTEEDQKGGRKRLFKGFDEQVKGDCKRRQGECVVVKDVREWMDKLCAKVVKELKAMPKVKYV